MLAVVRHGDRTPKQKMKMKVTQVGLCGAVRGRLCMHKVWYCCFLRELRLGLLLGLSLPQSACWGVCGKSWV